MAEPLFKLMIWGPIFPIQRIEAQVDLKIQGNLTSSPSNVGYQNLQADSNKAMVMEILIQMPSSQGKRGGKKDYTKGQANYRKPEAFCQGRGRMSRGGGQEKF